MMREDSKTSFEPINEQRHATLQDVELFPTNITSYLEYHNDLMRIYISVLLILRFV